MAAPMQVLRNPLRLFRRSLQVITAKSQISTRKEKSPVDSSKAGDTLHEDEILEPKFIFSTLLKRKPGLPVDLMLFLQRKVDLSPTAIRDWWRRSKEEVNSTSQIPNKELVKSLGPDLAAAYFVINGGGKVRFAGHPRWISNEDKEKSMLPQRFAKSQIEAVDLSGTPVTYEGLKNFENVKCLKWLSLRNCPQIDDWCLDMLSLVCHQHLEHLDLSSCRGITDRGIPALHRLRNLKTLVMEDLGQLEHKELIAILLEESLPSCNIQGISFTDP